MQGTCSGCLDQTEDLNLCLSVVPTIVIRGDLAHTDGKQHVHFEFTEHFHACSAGQLT